MDFIAWHYFSHIIFLFIYTIFQEGDIFNLRTYIQTCMALLKIKDNNVVSYKLKVYHSQISSGTLVIRCVPMGI